MRNAAGKVIGGVDTHKDTHTAVALDGTGRLLGTTEVPASADGYQTLREWFLSFGAIERVGIEGTSSYGAGLFRYLRARSISIVEVNRTN